MTHKTPRYCYGLTVITVCHDGTTIFDDTWWASNNSRTKILNFRKHYDETHRDEVKSSHYYICDPVDNVWHNVTNEI